MTLTSEQIQLGKYIAIAVIIGSIMYIIMTIISEFKRQRFEELANIRDNIDASVNNQLEDLHGTMNGHLAELDGLLEINDSLADNKEYNGVINSLNEIKETETIPEVLVDADGFSRHSNIFQEYV
jgi:sensor domain CHASE-containing protein